MKAVLFCRVSSKEQEETGYSLTAQERLLGGYADKHTFEVSRVFSISESASGKSQREIFSQMICYVQKENIKIIVCEKVDRLTRNFKDAVTIDEWLEKDEERQVHLVKDSLILHKNSRSQEKLNWGIRILFAKNYIDNLSEEVKKGQKEKIAQGWLPTKPPLGYKTIGEKGHKTHIIDQDKAQLIKRMFELYGTGDYSLMRLTTTMAEEGLRNESGKKVVKSRIHELLTNPFYVGRNSWNGDLYDGKQETFITKNIFEHVQYLLKSKTTPKYRKHLFLFKALVRCTECGGVITWEIAKKRHIYGHCNHYRACTQKAWVKEPELEQQVTGAFDNLQIRSPRLAEWIRKALKESHQDQIAYHSASMNELAQRQEQLKGRLDRLYDDKLDSKITEEFYQKKYQQYSNELGEFSDTIKKHNESSLKYYELGINIFDLSQRAKEIYSRAQLEQKRQLISLVFSTMLLDEGRLHYKYTAPFQILSSAVAATNKSSKMTDGVNLTDKIFEPKKKAGNTELTGALYAFSPTLLRREDSNLQPRPYSLPDVSIGRGTISYPSPTKRKGSGA